MPPKITSRSPDEVNVHEGNVLYLKCDADGMPTPTIVWRKNGLALENTAVFNKNFLLENATKADAGAYECVASNSVGSDNYTVIVTILPTEGKRFCNFFFFLFSLFKGRKYYFDFGEPVNKYGVLCSADFEEPYLDFNAFEYSYFSCLSFFLAISVLS